MKNSRWPWAAFAWLVALIYLIPVGVVLGSTLFTGLSGQLEFPLKLLWPTLTDTSILVGGTLLFSVFVGTLVAWIVVRYDFPGRNFFRWAQILPLSIPAFIGLFAWRGLLEYTGPLATLWRSLNLPGSFPLPPPSGFGGAIWVMGLSLYPYLYFTMSSFFKRIPISLLEVGALQGWSPQKQFFSVVVPLARPALWGGMMLVLMEALGEFGVPNYLGIQAFSSVIYRTWLSVGNLGGALGLSSVLVLLVIFAMTSELRSRGRKGYAGTSDSKTLGQSRIRLKGPIAGLVTLLATLPLFFGFLVPTFQLIWWVFEAGIGKSLVWTTGFNTLLLGTVSAFLGVLISALLVHARFLKVGGPWGVLSPLLQLGYALPGAVLAIAFLPVFGGLDRFILTTLLGGSPQLFLSGSVVGLILAYQVRFSAVAFQPLQAGGLQTTGSLAEAGLTHGMGPWKVFGSIQVPLWLPSLVAAGCLMFVDLIKELPLTLILRPFNFQTLATRVYEAASNEAPAEGALEALLLVALAAVGSWLAHIIMEKRKR